MPEPSPGQKVAQDRVRGIIGKALLFSAVVMLGVAAAAWFGWLPLESPVRTYVAIAFLVAGGVDGVLALRFLGERAS